MIAPLACAGAFLLGGGLASGGEPDVGAVGAAPVRSLGAHFLRIGEVALDRRARVVRMPAFVNLRAGLVEYAVVTPRGKLHESTLATTADPIHIHAALLLLGLKVPAESTTNSTAVTENEGPAPDAPPLSGPSVRIRVAIPRPHGYIRRELGELVVAASTRVPMPAMGWTYNGSFIHDGQFAASATGSIVALQHDPAALINNPLPSRLDDSYHVSHARLLPRPGTPVTIEIGLVEPVGRGSR